VNEHICAAAILLDKAEALGGVKEFYGTSCHDDFLSIDIEKSASGRMPLAGKIEVEKEDRECAVAR
jgi:hypothetical protein